MPLLVRQTEATKRSGNSTTANENGRSQSGNGLNSSCNSNGNSGDSIGSFAPHKEIKRTRRRTRRREAKDPAVAVKAGLLCCAFCLLVGFTILVFSGDVGRSKNGTNQDGAVDGPQRVLSDLSKDDKTPLTEEQEQQIIHASHDELNKFPLSIGTDNGSNPEWETIEHPGDEVLKFFKGDAYHPKRRATVKDIAGLLSGKQLRGGRIPDKAKANSIEEGTMRVPKLWDPQVYGMIADERERRSGGNASTDRGRDGVRRYLGNFGSRLMTNAEAKSIGSRIPDEKGNLLETIFVAVASYRDWQCSATVESAFKRAAHPERLRVAVVDQIRVGVDAPCSVPPAGPCEQHPDQVACKYQNQIDYFTVDADLSVGPVFARHLGHRLYRGEYFAVQSDAHVAFVNGWDDEIVEQWHSAKNEMAVLSNYLSGTNDHINLETGERLSKSRPIMCMSDFEGAGRFKHLRHGQQPEGIPYIHDMPTLNPFWAAGFSFARGHFVVNIPYDQHLPWIFQGEEISIGLRGFSYGYDYYSAERSVCYHFYGRKDVPMFWENGNAYSNSGVYGMNRLNSIIHMQPPSINGETGEWMNVENIKYGIGHVRDLQLFFDIFGIHLEEQRVEKHLCRFVGQPMQKEFIPFLRKNEMGLDYDRITYRFVDKWKDEQ